MGNDAIINALNALYDNVDSSNLNDSEKNAMRILIEKVIVYYNNRYDEIKKRTVDNQSMLFNFLSAMTDYIVILNDTLKGKNDVYHVVNMICKEISSENKKCFFKRKRLIK